MHLKIGRRIGRWRLDWLITNADITTSTACCLVTTGTCRHVHVKPCAWWHRKGHTPAMVSGGGLNMGFCLPRAAAATVPRSPSWSYCFWISLTLRPVASASACVGVEQGLVEQPRVGMERPTASSGEHPAFSTALSAQGPAMLLDCWQLGTRTRYLHAFPHEGSGGAAEITADPGPSSSHGMSGGPTLIRMESPTPSSMPVWLAATRPLHRYSAGRRSPGVDASTARIALHSSCVMASRLDSSAISSHACDMQVKRAACWSIEMGVNSSHDPTMLKLLLHCFIMVLA